MAVDSGDVVGNELALQNLLSELNRSFKVFVFLREIREEERRRRTEKNVSESVFHNVCFPDQLPMKNWLLPGWWMTPEFAR